MTRRGKRSFLAFGIVAVGFLSLRGTAQIISPFESHKSSRQDEYRRSILVDTEMVLVDVTVTRADGTSVLGLDKGNFQLFEDGIEQDILSFSREDALISIGLIFDMSESMSDKVNESRQGALQFLKTSSPRDEFVLVSFSDRAELTSPFTFDINKLQKSIMSEKPKGHTALLDAIYLAMSRVKEARYNKHALLVISDGGDNHSRYNKTQVRNALKEADCSLYAIGFFVSRTFCAHLSSSTALACFRNLPKLPAVVCFRCRDWKTCRLLAPRLEWSYAISTSSGIDQMRLAATAGGEESRVKVATPTPFNVSARAGYYGPKN